MRRGLAIVLSLASASACARGAVARQSTPIPAPVAPSPVAMTISAGSLSHAPDARSGGPCANCLPSSMTDDERQAIERRIAELKHKGGHCSSYAAVIERSYRNGQITIRPYMWRVGAQLASGEAHPDGAMILAREIDPLNRGRRPFDEVVWTIEHEAAHIAFQLDSPLDRGPGDRADSYVKACRS